MTPIFFLLIIWGLGGKEMKFINKDACVKIDKALFRISGKNLYMSKLNRCTVLIILKLKASNNKFSLFSVLAKE